MGLNLALIRISGAKYDFGNLQAQAGYFECFKVFSLPEILFTEILNFQKNNNKDKSRRKV